MISNANKLSLHLTQIQALTPRQATSLPDPSLKIWQLPDRKLSCFYAPFEHVNTQAKLIIVGITPGGSQMNRSLNTLNNALLDGQNTQQALKFVKQTASLSGPMRPRLIDMLNRLGYAQKLGIACCSSLWAEDNNLVHFCPVLKYPIFVNGKDYSGQPKLFNVAQLKSLLFEQFVNDMQPIDDRAHILPLGEMVTEVLTHLDQSGNLKHFLPRFNNHIVSPPHPSGANAESIALIMTDPYPSSRCMSSTSLDANGLKRLIANLKMKANIRKHVHLDGMLCFVLDKLMNFNLGTYHCYAA